MTGMPRARKLILALFVLASLVIVVLWFHSYRRYEVLVWGSKYHALSVGATYGEVSLRHVHLETGDAHVGFSDPGFQHRSATAQPTQLGMYASDCSIFWVMGPFSFIVGQQQGGDWQTPGSARWTDHLQELVVPYWFVLVLTLAPTPLMIYRHVKRPRTGHCVKCGYDLRASPDRCPECGAAA
jgi:hypothetical protein